MPKLVPSVKVTLDKERCLRLDLNAMVSYEQASGESITTFGGEKPTALQIRALLWASLLHDDGDLRIEDVGAMVHAANLSEIATALGEVLRRSVPTVKKATEASKNRRRSNGSNSGQLADTISA